jgi:hypothetical protein
MIRISQAMNYSTALTWRCMKQNVVALAQFVGGPVLVSALLNYRQH